jgi:nucleotide-binding universal stress UspA family protein
MGLVMKLRGPVLVGTDLTNGSEAALRDGRRLADDLGSALIVCHVLPEIMRVRMLFPQWGGIDADFQEAISDNARAEIDRQLDTVLGAERGEIDVILDSGTAHSGLLSQAEMVGANVIVTGPGRVADQVVRHALVPVFVARPSPRGVVIGTTDFSDPSMPALATAAAEARRRRSRLHLLHVVDIGAYALVGGGGGGMVYLGATPTLGLQTLDDLRAAADIRLQACFERFALDGAAHALSGPAASTIVERADAVGAELIVVGTHGRTGFARLTLGSTAEQIIRSAPCSVLVVRLSF